MKQKKHRKHLIYSVLVLIDFSLVTSTGIDCVFPYKAPL